MLESSGGGRHVCRFLVDSDLTVCCLVVEFCAAVGCEEGRACGVGADAAVGAVVDWHG